jgi:hypothetical protein
MGNAKRAEVDQEYEHEQPTSAWMVAHRALSRLAKERAAADAEEGRWLLAALRSATHLHLGFGSFSEYVERSFGYKPRSTQEKLRVAEALEQLPVLTQALEQGTLHWSAVRELTRVAVPENERAWLALADGKSVRQLEELVAGKALGDDPASPSRAPERRHVLRFEVAPDTFALFCEAMAALRRNTDGALDDDAALLTLARLALGGSRDEGRASYQIAVTLCAACGRGYQPANGELVPISPEIVAMAHCDGQHLGCIAPRAANDSAPVGGRNTNIDAHVGADAHAGNYGAPVDGRDADIAAHVGAPLHADNVPMRAPVRESVRAPEESVRAHQQGWRPHAHVGANGSRAPSASSAFARAHQTVTPALRRSVLLRDHHRCVVPGCRNAIFVDLHHLKLRSEQGRNDADNLITLCGAHHRAAHRGQLVIQGSSATAVVFRHADGSAYGQVMDARAHEARAKTFRALCGLGFRESDVRAALEQLEAEGKLAAATTEQCLRAALARLTMRRSRP